MSISKHDLFEDRLAFVLLTSTFFGTVFQLVSCQLVRVTGTNTWSKHPVGFLYNSVSVFERQTKTTTIKRITYIYTHTNTHCVLFTLSNIILCTRKWTNHNSMRHFLFGILFVFTISFHISSIPLVLLTLSPRCVHDDDVKIIKQIDVKKTRPKRMWTLNSEYTTKKLPQNIFFSWRKKKKNYTYIRVIEKQSTVFWGSGIKTTNTKQPVKE